MKKLIERLRSEFNSKPSPGILLNQLGEEKLAQLLTRYPNHNSNALWIGAYLADMFITEAIQTGDITKHVPMALNYAKEIIAKEGISDVDAQIILELIATHHGGEQKHLESKLFKNADCFKFLLPRGVFHIFSSYYKPATPEGFAKGMQYAMFKVEEKYRLVDLDEELMREAKEFYDHWQFFFNQVGVERSVPSLYKK